MPQEIQIAILDPSDDPSELETVLEIEQLSFGEGAHPKEFFLSELQQKQSTLLVAKLQTGRLIAFLDFWKILDEIHLINLAVHPDHREQGVATQLFTWMMNLDCNVKTVFLEVRVSNKKAQHFYLKHGFSPVGLRKAYYSDGEDAVVMVNIK